MTSSPPFTPLFLWILTPFLFAFVPILALALLPRNEWKEFMSFAEEVKKTEKVRERAVLYFYLARIGDFAFDDNTAALLLVINMTGCFPTDTTTVTTKKTSVYKN